MKPASWSYLVAAILIVFIAVWLRVWPLSSESVDGDELFSRRVAMADAGEGWTLARNDLVHPPLYYLLLKAATSHADSPSAYDIRVLSLVAGIASIAVVIAIGLAVPALRGPTLLAALLAALNSSHVFYSQQARSYALYCLLVALLLLWCTLVDRHWHKRQFWGWGTVLMSALVWTHYVGALYCIAAVCPLLFARQSAATSRRFRIKSVASPAVAFLLFLPWLIPEIAIYIRKSGLSTNLEWQGVPALFDLKYTFAHYIGIPDFRGGTTVAVAIGLVLLCCAFLPGFSDARAVNPRIRITLLLMAIMPPISLFLATRWPLRLPVFAERQVLPSLLPALILVCYGLWRIALLAPKRAAFLPLLGVGALTLVAFQLAPVYRDWSGPMRHPHSVIADDLKRIAPGSPVYTTWPYGIGEPVAFYLQGSRKIDQFPIEPAMTQLPQTFIMLYRPAAAREDQAVRPLLRTHNIVVDRYYSGARSPKFGTRLLVLSRSNQNPEALIQ